MIGLSTRTCAGALMSTQILIRIPREARARVPEMRRNGGLSEIAAAQQCGAGREARDHPGDHHE